MNRWLSVYPGLVGGSSEEPPPIEHFEVPPRVMFVGDPKIGIEKG